MKNHFLNNDISILDTILDRIDPDLCEKKNQVEKWPKFFQHRYAFFDLDSINIDVQITEIYNPSQFYVRLVRFNTQLNQLEENLKNEYEKYLLRLQKNRQDMTLDIFDFLGAQAMRAPLIL